jgi:hypothetical protein
MTKPMNVYDAIDLGMIVRWAIQFENQIVFEFWFVGRVMFQAR